MVLHGDAQLLPGDGVCVCVPRMVLFFVDVLLHLLVRPRDLDWPVLDADALLLPHSYS